MKQLSIAAKAYYILVLEPLPEKQGLKPVYKDNILHASGSIRATSRKTRIESYDDDTYVADILVLEPLPEKQGLKHS